jgi:hypothetical protein
MAIVEAASYVINAVKDMNRTAKDTIMQVPIPLLEPEYFDEILEKLNHAVFSEQLGFNFVIKLA